MEHILIVVDMQRDFVDMALGTPEAVGILPYVKEKIAKHRAAGGRVIFTRDTHQNDYLQSNEGKYLPVAHCIEGTEGWQLCDGLAEEGDPVINKPTFGFLDWWMYIPQLPEMTLELIGLCTDICVVSNALLLKALYPNATVAVDPRACAGVTPQTHHAALTTMCMCQVEIRED